MNSVFYEFIQKGDFHNMYRKLFLAFLFLVIMIPQVFAADDRKIGVVVLVVAVPAQKRELVHGLLA